MEGEGVVVYKSFDEKTYQKRSSPSTVQWVPTGFRFRINSQVLVKCSEPMSLPCIEYDFILN